MAGLTADGPVPMYYQLELLIRNQIASGFFAPGDKLPGEQVLAKKYGVSRVTVRRALDRLEEDGLIVRRQGRRATVAPHATSPPPIERDPTRLLGFEDEMRRLGLLPHAKLLEATSGIPPSQIASMLGISPDQEVVRIRRLGFSGGSPLWLESRYFPLDVGQALLQSELSAASVLKVLVDRLGLRIVRVDAHLMAVLPTPRQAQLLNLTSNVPLLFNQSVAYTSDRAVEVVQSYLRGDQYKLVLSAEGPQDPPVIAGATTSLSIQPTASVSPGAIPQTSETPSET